MMHYRGFKAGDEVMRLAFARLGLTAAEMDDLLPPDPSDAPPPLPDMASLLGLDSGPLQTAGVGDRLDELRVAGPQRGNAAC